MVSYLDLNLKKIGTINDKKNALFVSFERKTPRRRIIWKDSSIYIFGTLLLLLLFKSEISS